MVNTGHVLGSGAFGKVYLARTRSSPNYIVALKALKKQRLVNTEMEVQFRREIEIQSQLRYIRILRFRSCYLFLIRLLFKITDTPTYFDSMASFKLANMSL